MKRISLVLFVVLACSKSPTTPEQRIELSVVGGDIIYGPPNVALPEPLQVLAVDAATKLPVEGIEIDWQVTSGGGSITAATSTTDIDGVAETTFQAAAAGTYRIRASTEKARDGTEFEIRIVTVPQITSLEPAVLTTGGTVVVRGSNFSPIAEHNAVLFDGVRGTIQSASATELRVTVPACLPSGTVAVTVALGFATSGATQAQVTSAGGTPLSLTPGASLTYSDPAELSCVRLPGGVDGAFYLLTVHNVAATHTPPLHFELRELHTGAVTNVVAAPTTASSFASSFELGLRHRERAMLQQPELDEGAAVFAPTARVMRVPQVGERASFNVITRTNTFQKVNARARIVSTRAAIFVDEEAPAPGFTDADLQSFANLFDNPIYPTDVAVFGQHSDIDNNERILILFTPRVNELTPRGQSSFAAAYFYGCDLLTRSRCSGTNLGEIFYAMVPDPSAVWSDRRTVADVLKTVPPVLAHELQHMIHFARRGQTTDALWLSEALAHTAEELVGDALAQGAFGGLDSIFRRPNYRRAQSYLRNPGAISMLAEEPPGSLELRGGAWLFLKHLRGHYGENDLLSRLTASTRSGVENVTQATQLPWSTLLRDFGVALWADGAPDFAGGQPDSPQQVFNNFNPRLALDSLAQPPGGAGFTLLPQTLPWGDFAVLGSIGASSQTHFRLVAPVGGGANLNFVLSGPRGASFAADAAARLTILRVR